MRLKGWIWFFGILLAINLAIGLFGRQFRFDAILVHHSAGQVGDLAIIRAMHEKRGWTDAAYHLLLSNGSTEVPAGYLEATSRFLSLSYSGATKNHEANLRDLHICIVGNYQADEVPDDLKPAIGHALMALCEEFSIDPSRIVFHRDVGNTACPGKNLTKDQVTAWMQDLADQCPETLKIQHQGVIDASSLSLENYPHGLLVLQACASLVFAVLWFGLVLAFRKPPSRNPSRRGGSRFRTAHAPTRRKKPRRNRHR